MLLHLSDHSPEPLRSQIARQLRSKILLGDLEPGAELPPAQPLARSHRVGVGPVTQALDELVCEGLLLRGDDGRLRVAELSGVQRRALADQALREDPQQHELSLAELQLARDIQTRLLPPPVVLGDGFATVARCFPARFLAGDLYDVIPHGDGSVGVVVADVAGKGFAAALLMASVKAMTPFVAAGRSVEATLGELNRRLADELGPREFVALAYARFSPQAGTVTLANAGLPDPYLVRAGRPPEAVEVSGPRLPLGLRPALQYRATTFELRRGERLLLYTDGLPEARERGGEQIGYDGFANLVAAAGAPQSGADDVAATEAWLDGLLAAILERTGPTPGDDCTAVVVQHRGTEGEDTVILSLSELSAEPLHGQISRQVRARILARELVGGEMLPSIRTLARDCRVSVITVQRAYEDLEREGLLLSHPGKGFYVAQHTETTTREMAERRFAVALAELIRRSRAEGLDEHGIRRAVEGVLHEAGGAS